MPPGEASEANIREWCIAYLRRTVKHHVEYRTQLLAMKPSYSGIKEEIPTGGPIGRRHYYLFFVKVQNNID